MKRSESIAPRGAPCEIWLAVAIDRVQGRALMIRHATLRGEPCTWASAFDAGDPTIHRWAVTHGPWEPHPDHLTGAAGDITWDLTLAHRHEPVAEGSLLGTRSIACSPFASVSGTAAVGDKTWTLEGARGLLTHIWGARRFRELCWIFVPAFDDDPQVWGIEAVAVRPARLAPWITAFKVARGERLHHAVTLGGARLDHPEAELKGACGDYRLHVRGRLHDAQVTPFVYRDPKGTTRFVEQSAVAETHVRIQRGTEAWHLWSAAGSALEFHGPRPWSGRAYADPYAAE